ncbi:disease resistance protein RUN1-like [Rhodamnia argentea]|uniref:Disease resistance protein RUN1-like n=1 Tax=Rhodamnia argentea TaxID=178133 RepID=A0ABM3H4K1_9MYRT|nr:disease resistance protein RUN1-like [Rhodamnia argentea]
MASSSKSTGPYAVFLSFRGTDVRNSFASHLYNALVWNGIHTFRDNEELRKGQDISMVLKAIEESRIAIIIFSEDYTSSWWCLEEVAKIMECKNQKYLTVLPVFYKVAPREVREGRASYATGLAKHESKHSEKMERWKRALSDAGNLIGWTLNDGDDESKLIQDIVKNISTRLSQTPLDVAENPVGIESRVAELKSMLNLESKDDVLMVGLWGQGGIGKTTLGKAINNDISEQFDGSSFLAGVRENSEDCKGLVTLQEQLLNDILLPHEKIVVPNVHRGVKLIQDRLSNKRVLVILDDVDNEEQLNALAGKAKWFGSGSRILVTTRDRHFMTPKSGWDHVSVYEVKVLDDGEARELLGKHAFPTYQKLESRTDLVRGFLNHAKGLPLALVVLGCSLRSKTEDVWESILEELSMTPNRMINNVLRVSYDGLDENEQEIFLHIACFFKGWEREYAKKVLDSCNLRTTAALCTLIERCLIRIEYGKLQMHDLIQLMGRKIVNHGYRDDPEKRSRLWLYDDVRNVLQHNKGDCNVKAIVLEPHEPIEIYIGLDAFTKMRKLRLLILRNVHNSFQDPVCFPSWLRWLEWHGYPHIPEFSSGSMEIVGLDMSKSSIAAVPEQFKDFRNLKYMNFDFCKSLVRTPDISWTPNLEELHLNFCKNLVEVHESIGDHGKLQVLDLHNCSKLSIFPKVLEAKNLRELQLGKCTKLERFPDVPHKLEGITKLDLEETAIKGLPASIENLVSLEEIKLDKCKNLVSLPSSIYKLQNLKYLMAECCTNLIGFPKFEDSDDPRMKTGLPNLEELHLNFCENLVEVHESIGDRGKLQVLDLRNCSELSIFPKVLEAKNLRELQLGKCTKLERFPDVPHKLEGITKLDLEETAIKGLPASIENLVSLETLSLNECKNLVSLPSSIYKLQKLTVLDATCCTNLIGFPKFEDSDDPCMKTGLSNLWILYLDGCNLTEVEFLENLSCCPILKDLFLRRNNIKSLPTSISKRDDLFFLDVSECPQLREIPELPLFLGTLDADNSESLQKSDSTLIHHFVRRGLAMADSSSPDQVPHDLEIFLEEGEMPEWVLPVEEGSVSFKASKGLYEKFLGLAFCFDVCRREDPSLEANVEILPYVDGEMRKCKQVKDTCLRSPDFMWIWYFVPSDLWDVVDFGQIDGNYVQFSLRVSTENVEKWGLRIICKPLENDLKAVLRNNRLMDPALLLEVVLESTDSEVESKVSSIKTDILKDMEDCQMSIEKHNQIVSKRNQKLMLPQGKQTKTMSTSNSADRDENGSAARHAEAEALDDVLEQQQRTGFSAAEGAEES